MQTPSASNKTRTTPDYEAMTWSAPRLRIASIAEITRQGSGSPTDADCTPGEVAGGNC